MAWITGGVNWTPPKTNFGEKIGSLVTDYRAAQADKLKYQEQADQAARQRAIYEAFKGGIPLNEAGEPDIDKAINMMSPNDPAGALKLSIDREAAKATLAYRQAQLANTRRKGIPTGFEEDPDKPGAIRRMPGFEVQMTPTLQNNILKADEAVSAGKIADQLLGKAQQVNPKAFSEIPFGGNTLAGNITAYDVPLVGGITAPYREAGRETLNLKNIVTNQAVSQLKLAFGGNPTEGERKILIELQGSVDLPASVRAEIFQRARDLLKQRQAKNIAQSKGLRTGEYLAPGGGPTGDEEAGATGETDTGEAEPFDPSMTEEDVEIGKTYSFPDGVDRAWDGENFNPVE